MKLGFGSGRSNSDVSVRGRAVDARDATQDERIAARNQGAGADGGGEGQIVRADISAYTDTGVVAAGRVEVAREHSEE